MKRVIVLGIIVGTIIGLALLAGEASALDSAEGAPVKSLWALICTSFVLLFLSLGIFVYYEFKTSPRGKDYYD